MHPSRVSVVQLSYCSTCDVASTKRAVVLGSIAMVWLYIVRHLEEKEMGLVSVAAL